MTRSLTLWLAMMLPACSPSPAASPSAPEPRLEPSPKAKLAYMKVYDAQGKEHSCALPEQDCPPARPDASFAERCRLAGFRIQRCGCDAMCTGPAEKPMYDASGRVQPCERDLDCVPAPAGAAFQDACNERGHKLEQCGCAFLCTGDPTR